MNTSHIRVRRHLSFIVNPDMVPCNLGLAHVEHLDATHICEHLNEIESCAFYVFYTNYLHIMHCRFQLDYSEKTKLVVTIISVLMLCLHNFILKMIAKYFYLPNLITLNKKMPFSSFVYGYTVNTFFFLSVEYIDAALGCPLKHKYTATLKFAEALGGCFIYMSCGNIMLCRAHYCANGNLFWSCMFVICGGYVYLLFLIGNKMEFYKNQDDYFIIPSGAQFRTKLYYYSFIMYILITIFVSIILKRREKLNTKTSDTTIDYEFSSDEDLDQKNKLQSEISAYEPWLEAVNAFKHIKEYKQWMLYIIAPFYFVIALIVPVIDENRILGGWCKSIVCLSTALCAICRLPFNPLAEVFVTLTIIGFISAIIIFLLTHAQRKPKNVEFFSIVGLLMSSTLMNFCIEETNAIFWQLLSFYYSWQPDLIVIITFNLSIILAECVIVWGLLIKQHGDLAFGVVMGMTTATIYSIYPMFVLHDCYTEQHYIAISANGETTYIFMFVMCISCTFGISICGYEFRQSFVVHISLLCAVYYVYQFLSLENYIHPLGTVHSLLRPMISENEWA